VTGSRLCKYRHFLPHPTPPHPTPLPLHMFFAAGGEEMEEEEEEEEEEGRDAWLRGTVNQVIGWRGGVEFVIDRSSLVFNLCPRARGI